MIEVSPEEHWREIIDAAKTLQQFNEQIVQFMPERGPVYVRMVALEARRRGYLVERIGDDKTGRYMQPVTMVQGRADGMKFGYQDGTLFVQFPGKDKVYEFPQVPEADFGKLCRSIFPRNLLNSLKKKWEKSIVSNPAPNASSPPL
jgi:hypothetical protein